jgi:hypothetical protein
MHRDKVAVLLICLAAVAGIAALRLFHSGGTPVVADDAVVKPSATGEFRGACLQLHNGDPNHPWELYIDEIAATGANTVCLVVTAYQENCASTSIFVDLRKTPTDPRLKSIMDHAHQRHLRVVLMPIILLENPREGEWRGKIAPTTWSDWWEDYENCTMHYAWLAESAGAEVFMIGSELVSTEADTDRWKNLIARVRKAYRGRVGYSANWDHYKQVGFWDCLDLIGMTTYHDLSDKENPTVADLVASWEPIKKEILDWQKQVNRSIVFTEVGWPNQVTCAKYAWDYYRSADKPDPQAQANCFEAFFRTWASEPAVAGYLIWEWRSYPGQELDPQKDTSYVPCGKPAMDVIARYFRAPPAHERELEREKAPSAGATRPAIAAGKTTNDGNAATD